MNILIIFLSILLGLTSIILIALVLFQDDQGEGFGLFGSGGQSGFTPGFNPLARLTTIFAVVFFVLALGMAFFITRGSGDSREGLLQESRETSRNEDWFLEN